MVRTMTRMRTRVATSTWVRMRRTSRIQTESRPIGGISWLVKSTFQMYKSLYDLLMQYTDFRAVTVGLDTPELAIKTAMILPLERIMRNIIILLAARLLEALGRLTLIGRERNCPGRICTLYRDQLAGGLFTEDFRPQKCALK